MKKNENLGIFNNGIQIDQFIEKKLMELEDLHERRFARDLMTEIFQGIAKYTNDTYKELENNLCTELMANKEFSIVTGIVPRTDIDVTNDEMFPMLEEDLKEVKLTVDDMRECLSHEKPIKVYSVFVQADESVLKKLKNPREDFACTIKTSKGEYRGKAHVQLQTQYTRKIQDLFRIFQVNGVKWQPVCAPYLRKIFNVYIDSVEIPEEEMIEEVRVEFREYEPYIKYQMVPVWNLELLKIISDMQSEGCIDQIHYRHNINHKRLNDNCKYLVTDATAPIYEVWHGESEVVITPEQIVKSWYMYRVVSEQKRHYEYKLFSNELIGMKLPTVKTEGGIRQYIDKMGYAEYVSLKEMKLISKENEVDTYQLEQYLTEEYRVPTWKEVLELTFVINQERDYLTKDIVSYLVAAVQRECREYRCVGKIL